MTLIELAERVEAATGPDRELDKAIAEHALGWQPPVKNGSCGPNYSGRGAYEWHDAAGEANGFYVPSYTASLDAAMSLVPEGWWVTLTTDGGARASLHNHEWLMAAHGRNPARGMAATPALALTAAALRARSVLQTQGNEEMERG